LKTRQVRLDQLGDERGVFKIEVEDSKRANVTESEMQIIYSPTNLRKSWQ